MGSVLSIDYGLKRIGLAISDPLRNFAFPLTVIENKSYEFVLNSIIQIIKEKEVEVIIVGIPYDASGRKVNIPKQKQSMQDIIEDFINRLKHTISIPIEKVDERYSSFSAEENLKDAGINSRSSKRFVDMEAARLILEDFLSSGLF